MPGQALAAREAHGGPQDKDGEEGEEEEEEEEAATVGEKLHCGNMRRRSEALSVGEIV